MGLDQKACDLLTALRERLVADGQPDYHDEPKAAARPKKATLTPTQKRRARRKRAEVAADGASNAGESPSGPACPA
jgi:hypothetical protein